MENIQDCRRNGKMMRSFGGLHHLAKLTEDDIPVIRRLRAEGMTYAAIAARYDVTKANIRQICLRLIWAHVA